MDPLALHAIERGLQLVGKARDATKALKDAELRILLADLQTALAEAKMEGAALMTRVAELEEENDRLRRAREEQPELEGAAYYFDGDKSKPYCIRCWTTQRYKAPIVRTGTFRVCAVCDASILWIARREYPLAHSTRLSHGSYRWASP